MNNDNKLQVNLLGGCSISCGDKTIDSNSLHSKKIWTILSYLIVFRNRDISQSELIDLVYAEDNSINPMNALKTLMHRVRAALDDLYYIRGKNIILQQDGAYKWNRALPIEVDIDIFEEFSQKANSAALSEDMRLKACLEAIDIFKGDFVPKIAMEPWAIPLNTYYRSQFLSLVHKAIKLLEERMCYDNIVTVCHKAITIEPYDEFLYYSLMKALVNLGQYQDALSQYEKTTNLFYKEFGVTPSTELKALYKQIVHSNQSVEMDISAIKENLREEDDLKGAFYCEYEFFKDIYRLEVRSVSRSGKPIHICLLTISPKPGEKSLNTKTINSAMDKLCTCVKNTLRRGDVFARYSVSQFVIMLPMTTVENAEMVLGRIVKRFHAANPRAPGELTFCFQPIDSIF